jgi:anti-sigma B factor antagonist
MSDETARLSVATPEASVYVLSGEVDAHTAPQFADYFEPLPTVDDGVLVIDMADVTFMDSSGLRVLIELNRRIGESGASLTVRSPSRSVAKIIEISGLSDIIEVSSA